MSWFFAVLLSIGTFGFPYMEIPYQHQYHLPLDPWGGQQYAWIDYNQYYQPGLNVMDMYYQPEQLKIDNDPVLVGQLFATPIGNLRIVSKLGEGSFGSVFHALTEKGYEVAIKFETKGQPVKCILAHSPPGYMSMIHEVNTLLRMQGTPGFPKVYTSSLSVQSQRYYVMEYLGQNLHQYAISHPGGVLPQSELARLARQMVDRLQALHSKGILMYDTHPGNFLVHQGTVYAADLALAGPMNGQPFINPQCRQPVFGTRKDTGYAKDDLVRLIYTLVSVATGQLPWMNQKSLVITDFMKGGTTCSALCTHNAFFLLKSCRYIAKLKPGDYVNYSYLKSFML